MTRRNDQDDEELRNDPDFRALVEELRSQTPEQRARFDELIKGDDHAEEG